MGTEAKGKGVKSIKREEGFEKMKDIFLCLLLNLTNHGKITVANMYDDTFCSLKLVRADGEYDINITKREVKTEDKENEN